MMDNVQSHVSATRDDGRARELAGLALVAMIILSVGGAVAASAPADDAREACRADFQSLCAGVHDFAKGIHYDGAKDGDAVIEIVGETQLDRPL